MTINLLQFRNKNVRVTFRGFALYKGSLRKQYKTQGKMIKNDCSVFPYRFVGNTETTHTPTGRHLLGKESEFDIIHIEEIKTVTKTVDLSKYLNKEVLVTLRNGNTRKAKVEKNTLANQKTHPYRIAQGSHTTDGRWSAFPQDTSGFDIVKVEEIQVKKYQELEKKVAEMQKEIERLKKEETKVPEINEIEVTRTIIYAPDDYLLYCKESGVIPTQDGFIDFVADQFDHDFADEHLNEFGHQDIKELK